MRAVPLIVTGAGGRIGRLLRLSAADLQPCAPLWLARRPDGQTAGWDIAQEVPADLPRGATLLHLAAVLPGRGSLDDNETTARALVRADRSVGFSRVVVMSSVAVYAPEDGPIPETRPPAPASAYGQAKLGTERILAAGLGPRLTILRLANLAGADALLGGAARSGPVILDPIMGQAGGPVRSYIGPLSLARALGGVLRALAEGKAVPTVLNLAQPGAVAMADLLDAAGLDWSFGPARKEAVARVEVEVSRLASIVPLTPADPKAMAAELASLSGRWP